MDPQRLQILVVAADAGTLEAIGAHLRNFRIGADIHHASDADQAKDFLHDRGLFEGSGRADLMMLDLDLGDQQVRAVLEDLAGDEEGSRLPVVAVAADDGAAAAQLADFRIHEIIGKPLVDEDLLRVLRYFNEL